MNGPASITSRDNPLVKTVRRLARDNRAYRDEGLVWIEGEHLCEAALRRGWQPARVICTEAAWARRPPLWSVFAGATVLLEERLFAELSGLESPAGLGFLLKIDPESTLQPGQPTVVLDRVQDAGNMGSILRSAAAFGFRQVVALQGSAALWGPKVLRAGMGAHFGLHLVESASHAAVAALGLPLISTSPHAGQAVLQCVLPWPCAWVFGHEGQGVAEDIQRMADIAVRIDQPGGEESLNVAACAAICLHASSLRRDT